MSSFRKDLFLLIVIQLMSVKAFSQTYPVSASVQLSPPYSIYLADYVAPGSEQLKLHLLLKDLNQPFYDARLHMRIEGTGVVIENIPLLNIAPFTMEAGIPLTLSASDLSPYFNINNLSFSGITKNEFDKSGRLPEGYYRICFTVVDYRRPDVAVSNAGCVNIWVIQNDPPRINLPICGSDITLTDPQSIIFQWTPLHAASPNAANTTEYEFTLVEVRPEGRNPNDAINTSLPLYRERTMFPNLYYGPADPVMIPGQRYAFRVRAIDGMGRDLFKNNGYSEVCTFTFGKDVTLEPPANIKCAAEAERRARLSWDAQPDPTGYELAYRKKGEGYDWFYATTADIETVINDLDPETSYEARVTSLMNSYRSMPSEIITFTTPGRPEFSCGEVLEGIGPVEVKPLPSARAGNIFTVGEFELRVLKIEGSDGLFSGLGSMFIPYLGMNINCRFQNISVNINQQVIKGEVVAITEGVEGLLERWEQPEEQAEDEEIDEEIFQEPEPIAGEDITVEGIIKDIVVNMQDSTIIIFKEDGTTEEYGLQTPENNESGEKRFTDEEGNVWVVDREGAISSPAGADIPNRETTSADNLLMVQTGLIKEVLEYYKTEIDLWLENYGKGPLEKDIIKRLLGLPDCFPQDENQLLLVLEKVDYYLDNREELINLIEQDSTTKERFRFLVNKLNEEQPPYLPGLTESELDELITMTCPYLTIDLEEEEEIVIEGLSWNPDFVVINEINDTFDPGKNRLMITYTIVDNLSLAYNKLEIYKLSEDTTLITSFTDLPRGEKIEFKDYLNDDKKGWSGKGADGEQMEDGNYLIKLTASPDQDYLNGFQDYESINIKNQKYVTVIKDSISSAADQAVDYGNDFVGNSSWAACNICTRAAVYISTGKGDTVLFPKGGSRIGNSVSKYLKGDINDPGKANNIYDDLNSGLVKRFEYISDMVGEDYPDFEQLQDDSNAGQIIVGVYRNTGGGSGHIVMIVPGTAKKHIDESKFTLKDNITQIKLPKILECGSNHRENATQIDDNMSESIIKSLKWYKLKISD